MGQRVNATGRGTAIITREAAEKWNIDLKGAKVVVQGFGNVGSYLQNFYMNMVVKLWVLVISVEVFMLRWF